MTAASNSTAALDANAALASAEPTRPSAQAACARTNGSGSESAEVSAGTASDDVCPARPLEVEVEVDPLLAR